jgi:hypothetical protein
MLLIHGRWMNCKKDTDGKIKENENSAKWGKYLTLLGIQNVGENRGSEEVSNCYYNNAHSQQ